MGFKGIAFVLSLFCLFVYSPPSYSETKKDDAKKYIVEGMEWKQIGPGLGGRSNWLAVDPNNDKVLYYSPVSGGIYKTDDRGKSWQRLAVDILYKNRCLSTYLTTVAPSNSDVVYMAGTARYSDFGLVKTFNSKKEVEKNLVSSYGNRSNGLFKSSDGGKKWELITGPLSVLGAIAIDPDDEKIVWTAGPGFSPLEVTYAPARNKLGDGVVSRTFNGGKTWQHAYAGCTNSEDGAKNKIAFGSIVVAPSSTIKKRTLFLSSNQGVFKSTDNGANWADTTSNLPHSKTEKLDLYNDKDKAKSIVFVTLDKTENKSGGVFKTTDNGATWEDISGNLDKNIGYCQIKCDHENPEVLYVARKLPGSGLFKTEDGGKSWKQINFSSGKECNKDMDVWNTGVDGNLLEGDIVISRRNSDRLFYADSASAIYMSRNAGKSWEQIYTTKVDKNKFQSRGIESATITQIIPSDTNIEKIYMLEPDFGLLMSSDSGDSWTNLTSEINKTCGPGSNTACGIYSMTGIGRKSGLLYASLQGWDNSSKNGLFCISTDDGNSWNKPESPEGASQGEIPDFAAGTSEENFANRAIFSIAVLQNGRILITKRTGLYYSDNRGNTWNKVETGIPMDNEYMFYKLYPSTKNPERVYAVCSIVTMKNGVPSTDAAVGEKVKNMFGGLYVSDDRGITWSILSENLDWINPVCLAFNENETDMYMGLKSWADGVNNSETATLYNGGLYKSTDGGKKWFEVVKCRNVPGAGIDSIVVNPKYQKTVYAAITNMYGTVPYSSIFRSIDSGITWEDVAAQAGFSNGYECLAVSPIDPSLIFAGTKGGGAFMGTDLRIKRIEDKKRGDIFDHIWNFIKK